MLKAKTEKTTRVSADARPDPRPEASTHGIEREIARETARIDREVAKAASQVARAAIAATESLNNGGSLSPMPAIAPMPPMPPLPNFGGKSIVGTLNGGGIDIKLTSMNGTITLRETK